jgi:hypothetical protein
MARCILLLWIFVLAVSPLPGQEVLKVPLRDASQSKLDVVRDEGVNGFEVVSAVGNLSFTPEQTTRGTFEKIQAPGYIPDQREGYPALPVKTRLIEIPAGARVEVIIKSYQEEQIALADRHIQHKLYPAQPPRVKNLPDTLRPFQYKPRIYQANRFLGGPPVEVEEIGTFRHVRLGRLKIAPVQYHPGEHRLRVLNNLQFEIRFTRSHQTAPVKSSGEKNPYYTGIQDLTLNRVVAAPSPDSSSFPLTYVVVAPPEFKQSLRPFIQWKHQQGFNIIEAYTDSVGTRPEAIRGFLKQAFEQPEVSPPSFILLAGDVHQVPSWEGQQGNHVTDLPYGEYTGDYLPEVFYGRMPARDTAELNRMIEKTLAYEKYNLADPSYLGRSLLVAGDDEEFEDHYANGQVNYGTGYYFNQEQGIQSYSYLQDPVWGNQAVSDSIVRHINDGVGFANYTAHCAPQGWSLPGFQVGDIETLNINHKYGLWISNCCETLRFEQEESFGEAAIRKAGKGAIGVIGASNDTYWDEDYWWAIGLTSSISAHPTYEESGPGLYDRIFHTHQEDPSKWFDSQGEMVAAGNLAVASSTSSLEAYYWEVYHLLGDPSLMPYWGIPEPFTVSLNKPSLKMGMKALTVTTEPHAYVALTLGDEILDARPANYQGEAVLSFRELIQPGQATLVVTGQNRQPHIRQLTVTPDDQPYVITDSISVEDDSGNENGILDYGESAGLTVTLKNLSDTFDAYQVRDSVTSNDPYLRITDSLESYGSIEAQARSTRQAAFRVEVSDSVPDGHQAWLRMHVEGRDASDSLFHWETTSRLTIRAPQLRIGEDLWLNDPSGSDNQLEPGDTGRVCWVVLNEGNSEVGNIKHRASLGNFLPMKLLDTLQLGGSLPPGAKDSLSFRIVADGFIPNGMPLEMNLSSTGGRRGQYKAAARRSMLLGNPSHFRISQVDSASLCYGLFYDSGGEAESYANSENHAVTFFPGQPGKSLKAVFKDFDVERSYDWLKVYDGPTEEDAALMGRFDNNNPPEVLVAGHKTGALTFRFQSDYTVSGSGWKVELTCVDPDTVVFEVKVKDPPAHAVRVAFAGDTLVVDSSGSAVFSVKEGVYPYTVWGTGYYPQNGIVNVQGNMYQQVSLKEMRYDITFRLTDSLDGKAVEGKVEMDGLQHNTKDGSCTFTEVGAASAHAYNVLSAEYQHFTGAIRAFADTLVNIPMQQIRYPVKIHVADEMDRPVDRVDLRVDTLQLRTDSSGSVKLNLPGGEHELAASRPGYRPYEGSFNLLGALDMEIVLTFVSTSLPDQPEKQVLIYPNPTQGLVYVECSRQTGPLEVDLLTLTGRWLKKKVFYEQRGALDLRSYARGVYFLRVRSDRGEKLHKIVLK